nr:DnaB-like helicase N-terminal domain-containing protein [Streptomyces sp. SID3343]
MLGALLLEPSRIDSVRPHLRPHHMYRPAHAALYRALLDRPPDPGLTMADRTMALVRDAGAHAAGITPVYAHTLMAACPRPRHALVYARMIVEAADHRLVREHAVRLGQVAAADHARDGLADTLTHHRHLHRVLDDLHRRRPDHDTATSTPAVPTPELNPEPPLPGNLDDEQALIGALILDPAPMSALSRWLTPADFADTAHATLYRCVHALVLRGEPVDSLTLAWEAQHQGAFAAGDGGLTPELVAHIATSGMPADVDYRARRVLRAYVLRTAASAAAAVGTHAGDPTLSTSRLVTAARTALTPLDDALARRHNAITATKAPFTHTPPTTTATPWCTGVATWPTTGPDPTNPTAAHGPRSGRRP